MRYAHVLRKENNMLKSSRLKLILLCTIIPTLLVIGSLTNYNNDIYNVTTVTHEIPWNVPTVEIPKIEVKVAETVEIIQPIALPDPLPPLVEEKKLKALKEQIKCMAHNIYYEAGGEPYMGQVAVARVVMNRVRHGGFASSPCLVIYQTTKRVDPNTDKTSIHCQFSWVCQGKKSPDVTSERYKIAEEISHLVLTEDKWKDEFQDNILFFHNHTVKPQWPYKKSFVIGQHIFYAHNK